MEQSQNIIEFRYSNSEVGSTDYGNNFGFLFRYGFMRKSAKASGVTYFIFFDDMGNALRTSVGGSNGVWYTEVDIIYSENVQAFLDATGWTLE